MCLFVQYPIRDGDTVTLLLESLGAFAACWQAAPMQRTLDSPALEWRKQTGAHQHWWLHAALCCNTGAPPRHEPADI